MSDFDFFEDPDLPEAESPRPDVIPGPLNFFEDFLGNQFVDTNITRRSRSSERKSRPRSVPRSAPRSAPRSVPRSSGSRVPRRVPRVHERKASRESSRSSAHRTPHNVPKRHIIRGKIDDVHVAENDPTVRHREMNVPQSMSKYGLRNDLKTSENKERKINPDAELSRINPPYRVTLGEHRRTFEATHYLNRHIVLPQEVSDNFYYRVDDLAKNAEYQGLLVEVVGSKWIGSSKKIAWKCRTVGSGQDFYTLYLDATSRIQKDDPNVIRALRAKKKVSQRCFREDTIARLIEKLESTATEMRNAQAEVNAED